MRDFSPEKLEQLQAYLNSDISDLQKSINDIQLFDYDGIYGTDLIHSIQTYAGEFEERNYDAAIKVRLAFENVWEAEYRGSAVLNEVKEQLKEYNRYVQGLSEVMRSGRCSSPVSTRLYVGGLNRKVLEAELIGSGDITRRLYPGLKVPTISELEIQQKIRQIATTVLRNPQIIGVLNRETKRLFIKTFERLYNEAEQIVEPFVLKLEEIKYDCTAVIEDLKVYLYSKMEMLKKYSLKDYEVEETISNEDYEMIKEVFQEYGVPEDFTVDKVVILNQPDGACSAGHTAVMLIGEDGSGLFYSYRGNFEEEGVSIFLGQDAGDELETLYLTSERVEEFFVGETAGYVYEDYEYYSNIDLLDPDKIGEWEKMLYTRGTMIDIDNEQGMNMIIEAENIRMDEETGYNLYTNNCGQNASRIVAAGNEKYGATTGDGLNTRLMKVFFDYKMSETIGNVVFPGPVITQIGKPFLILKSILVTGVGQAAIDGTIPNTTYYIQSWLHPEDTSGSLGELYEEMEDNG